MSTRSQTEAGAAPFHALMRALWFEWKIAADYATGMSDPTRGTTSPPNGFVQNELGFGLDSADPCGPGCRCNPLSARRIQRQRVRRSPRTGRDWQKLVAGAAAEAAAAMAC